MRYGSGVELGRLLLCVQPLDELAPLGRLVEWSESEDVAALGERRTRVLEPVAEAAEPAVRKVDSVGHDPTGGPDAALDETHRGTEPGVRPTQAKLRMAHALSVTHRPPRANSQGRQGLVKLVTLDET